MSHRQIRRNCGRLLLSIRHDDGNDRILAVDSTAANVQENADKVVREYVAPPGKFTDPNTPADSIIRAMALVKAVSVKGPARPHKRLIQIQDWHLVPKDGMGA